MIKINPVNVQLEKRAISQCTNVVRKSRVLPLHESSACHLLRWEASPPTCRAHVTVPNGSLCFCSQLCRAEEAGAAQEQAALSAGQSTGHPQAPELQSPTSPRSGAGLVFTYLQKEKVTK